MYRDQYVCFFLSSKSTQIIIFKHRNRSTDYTHEQRLIFGLSDIPSITRVVQSNAQCIYFLALILAERRTFIENRISTCIWGPFHQGQMQHMPYVQVNVHLIPFHTVMLPIKI